MQTTILYSEGFLMTSFQTFVSEFATSNPNIFLFPQLFPFKSVKSLQNRGQKYSLGIGQYLWKYGTGIWKLLRNGFIAAPLKLPSQMLGCALSG